MSDRWAGPEIEPVTTERQRREFVDFAYRLNADDEHFVPPLRGEALTLLNPEENPWFEHGRQCLFLARRDGATVGRISAHVDDLALAQPSEQGMGPGVGNWGLLEASDQQAAEALIARAEHWLRGEGMTAALGPISISIWDEPGLLVEGHDHPPTVMMGHDRPEYEGWIEAAGYVPVKDLKTWELKIDDPFPPIAQRIIASGERNERIALRKVDKANFAAEARIIMAILNDAWSSNWGFVPLTDSEVAYAGKKLKPLVFEDLIRIASYDGEPVAFMITLPDMNERLRGMNGRLFPFGWAKLLWWLRKPRVHSVRVPLMGVVKRLQSSRLAGQLAMMMIEDIRKDAVANYGAVRGEIGWILDDNQGMNALAEVLQCRVNKVYRIYKKSL